MSNVIILQIKGDVSETLKLDRGSPSLHNTYK